MSMSKHLKLSSYTIQDSKTNQPIETSCVVSFSNYCWFEKIKDCAPKLAKCAKKDFDISFKLSSTAFQTLRNANSNYHFDKQGVKLTYNQCHTLFRSEGFVVEFLEKIKKYYDRDLDLNVEPEEKDEEEEVSVLPEISSQIPPPSPELDVENEEEEEEEEVPLKRQKKHSILDVSVKKLKRHV